ncbi:carbohydrate sulfotransferase 3-like [Rhipicephalus sanguineus]|uniref:carbohydrate sulfotransferase 3-like n=1 Tax=Rhipicephalus sanguineus TaxID=34632 RepID=UPI0020C37DC0|nr:carbohydrate sulfotransferase 3-like [Rhipicephalus sanguineus]
MGSFSTTKEVPSRTTRAGAFRHGVETSAFISVERSTAASRHSAIHQNASLKTSLKNHHRRLRLLKMVTIFKKNLSHYPVVPPDKVRRVIIVTYFRAGSNFVGELLSSSPPTFYHYEPLSMYTVATRLVGRNATEASSLISHLLRCELQSVGHYIRKVIERKDPLRRNRFLWALCRGDNKTCFRADFVSKVCARAPAQVMKITRLHMSQVLAWLRSNTDLAKSVKILHLVRDPRGILASRRLLEWCNESKSCVDPATLCSELRGDLYASEELQRTFPNSTYRVRYEDVSLDPKKQALKLFKALGLNHTVYVTSFLKGHSKGSKSDASDPYSTRRNSSIVPFQWVNKLKFKDIADIQRSCSDVMRRLGYKIIANADELLSKVRTAPCLA